MPDYRYTAVDARGKPVAGELQAAAPQEALRKLDRLKLVPQSICLSEIHAGPAAVAALSMEETAELASQVAELAKAGLPLESGLRALADELPSGRLPGVLRQIAARLEAGATLDEAIRSQGRRLPPQVRGLVLAGIRTGQVAEVFEEFADLHRDHARLWRSVWMGLAYPIALLLLVSLIFLFLQDFILPQFAQIYEDFEVGLPAFTRFMLYMSGTGTWLLEILLVLLIGLPALAWTASSAAWAGRLLGAVPLLGPMWRWNRLTQFARWMALLLGQQVPLPETLRLTAEGLGDAELARACRQVAEEVESGWGLAESLSGRRQFPPSVIPLVEWGQHVGQLSAAFRAAAEMLSSRTQTQRAFVHVILVPLVFLFVAGFVGFFLIALFQPMMSLIQRLT